MTVEEFYKRVDFNNGSDREINEWKILDIHMIPNHFSEQSEIDFYCCNDKEVFLLRLRNRATKKLTIVVDESGPEYPKYLIAELPIGKIDNDFLEGLLVEFMNLNC